MDTSKTYLWDNPVNTRHSVRLLCDEEGLNYEQKETLDATIHGESGYNTKAVNQNWVTVNGMKHLASTDYGLCQWNDYYHAKEISPDQALNNPEIAVRLMCSYWKRFLMNEWVAFSSGAYKRYLDIPPPVVITPPQAPVVPEVAPKPAVAPSLPSAPLPLTAWQRFCAFIVLLFSANRSK